MWSQVTGNFTHVLTMIWNLQFSSMFPPLFSIVMSDSFKISPSSLNTLLFFYIIWLYQEYDLYSVWSIWLSFVDRFVELNLKHMQIDMFYWPFADVLYLMTFFSGTRSMKFISTLFTVTWTFIFLTCVFSVVLKAIFTLNI